MRVSRAPRRSEAVRSSRRRAASLSGECGSDSSTAAAAKRGGEGSGRCISGGVLRVGT